MRGRCSGLVLVALAAGLLGGCENMDAERAPEAVLIAGGDPEVGRAAMQRYGCGSCHTVPGIRGADALVGPPLAGIANRMYIAGVLTNDPSNMMRWIQDPPAVDSLTAMPKLGVTESEARHIAAYLYTLK